MSEYRQNILADGDTQQIPSPKETRENPEQDAAKRDGSQKNSQQSGWFQPTTEHREGYAQKPQANGYPMQPKNTAAPTNTPWPMQPQTGGYPMQPRDAASPTNAAWPMQPQTDGYPMQPANTAAPTNASLLMQPQTTPTSVPQTAGPAWGTFQPPVEEDEPEEEPELPAQEPTSTSVPKTAGPAWDNFQPPAEEEEPEKELELTAQEPSPESALFQPSSDVTKREAVQQPHSLDDTQYMDVASLPQNAAANTPLTILPSKAEDSPPPFIPKREGKRIPPQEEAFLTLPVLNEEPKPVLARPKKQRKTETKSGAGAKASLSVCLSVLACIAALFYLVNGLYWVGLVVIDLKKNGVSILTILEPVFRLLKAVFYLGMSAVVAALGFQREEKKASTLLVGEGLIGIAISGVSLLLLAYWQVFYHTFFWSELLPILGAVATVGCSALLLVLMGIHPLAVLRDSETGFSVGALLVVTGETLSGLTGKGRI